MYLLSVNDLFSGKTVQALCWMLVHSLWMGLILIVAAGAIMLCTKKQSSQLRYNLLTGTFLLFTIAMLTVFALQLNSIGNISQQPTDTIATNKVIIAATQPAETIIINPGFTESIVEFFNRYANIIVMAWLVIIAFRCVRLVSGLRTIHKIKRNQLSSPGDYWNVKLAFLSERLNIKKPIQFFQSGIAKVPMVVGHFKPMILFPIGVLSSLSTDEIEAILIHELAHIRRKDYLVNMVQSFVEILFFFNPAVLWVSSLIKIERENCCDDIAVAQTSSKRNYINALVSFQEYNLGNTKYATALAGRKDHLLQRVKRMLHNNNKTLSGMEKTFLMLCLIITTSLSFIFSQAQSSKAKIEAASVINDSIPSLANRHINPKDIKEGATLSYTEKVNGIPHTLRVFKRQGVLYEIYGDVTSFKIDGKVIPQEQWGEYRQLMDLLIADYDQSQIDAPSKEASVSAPLEPLTPMEITKQDEISADDKVQQDEDKNMLQAEQDMKKADQKKKEDTKLQKLQQKQAKLDAELQKLNFKNDKLNSQKKAEQDKQLPYISHKREQDWTVDDGKTLTSSKLSYSSYDNGYYTSQPQPYTPYEPAKNSYILTGIQSNGSTVNKDMDVKALTQNFIDDLEKENVINTTDKLSYQMSNESLIVNGKVQPEAIHKKLKAKYIHSSDWKLLYNWRVK